ncbi:NAD(P)-dependent oxidoreductase [Parasporobacterium paucivorans]|uniref:Phosphoglycerate dehydrogenase n=1 Tax=Parasporobacterium paucivorans DSM 15970 TaxID=1122934 RepID=A0A1M6GWZ8_9FIRM|nr:NAD(P)-dependent oxidoreductase [Parasporobacterium paucivorans]SHJ14488.1 Phosphoglycerate dehydrogenase [Parasporobacterium paucivorans DSM 15970]
MDIKLLLFKQHSYNMWEYDDDYINRIAALGYDVVLHPTEGLSLPEEAYTCEVLATVGIFQHENIDDFKNLKFIQVLAAGFDHFPADKIKERKIILANMRGVYGIPISEFVLSGILNVYKQSRVFDSQKKDRVFRRKQDLIEIYGKTAAILGTGDLGFQIAKRLQAFGAKVIGFNRHPLPSDCFDEVHSIDHAGDFLPQVDIVILTLPLSDDSFHLAGKDFFRSMKPGSVFVNVGRGAVCDEGALVDALKNKLLLAAVLDVYEKEPLPINSPLWDLENVFLYPHTMSGSDNAFGRMKETLYRNLKAYAECKELENRFF